MKTSYAVTVFIAALSVGGCHAPRAHKMDFVAANLKELRGQALDPRKNHFDQRYFETRDALGIWVETELQKAPSTLDAEEFAANLNSTLKGRNLLCANECEKEPGTFDARGYLGEIEAQRKGDHLVVKIKSGILCGYDETASLYGLKDKKWTKLWRSARTAAEGEKYDPEVLDDILFTPALEHNPPELIATLGHFPWCTSNWQPLYYRLWQAAAPSPILTEEKIAFLKNPPATASLTPDRLLVFIHEASLDPSVHNYLTVYRYQIENGRAQRTAPYALTPRAFVEEWVRGSWETSRLLSEPSALEMLRAEHERDHSTNVAGEYISATHRCDAEDNWEIGIAFRDRPHERYFQVARTASGEYQMKGVRDEYSATCGVEDPSIDEERNPSDFDIR